MIRLVLLATAVVFVGITLPVHVHADEADSEIPRTRTELDAYLDERDQKRHLEAQADDGTMTWAELDAYLDKRDEQRHSESQARANLDSLAETSRFIDDITRDAQTTQRKLEDQTKQARLFLEQARARDKAQEEAWSLLSYPTLILGLGAVVGAIFIGIMAKRVSAAEHKLKQDMNKLEQEVARLIQQVHA